jgi:Kef-type K+ transport system membrane component KefB
MNNATASAAHFFLQLSIILVACTIMRFVMRRLGQAPVIGEMIAGVLLGPSLLGLLAPGWFHSFFPPESRPVLFSISLLGLTLYMFVVGLEFRADLFQRHFRTAASVSMAGILAPFLLGGLLALWLCHQGVFFAKSISLPLAILFMGAAMSITAFPMLARIIREQGLTGTPAGTIALAAGSFDDAAAWIFLAAVLGGMAGDPTLVAMALGGGLLYGVFCFFVIKPLLLRLAHSRLPDAEQLGLILLLLALGAYFTDTIGLYSVFGAFILGITVPRGGLAEKTAERIGPMTTGILLPVFFTYSGLNTSIGLLNSWMLWGICGLVILAAIAGKLLACYGAARFSGHTRGDSLTIASLMNARGLMELILLNIALKAGLINQTLFTILVLMAVVTTLMAAPFFNFARRFSANNC